MRDVSAAFRVELSPAAPSDADCIRAVLAGDAEAFGTLVERYQRPRSELDRSSVHPFLGKACSQCCTYCFLEASLRTAVTAVALPAAQRPVTTASRTG
jgi:hypothetical protein